MFGMLAAVAVSGLFGDCTDDTPVRVTVVVVLATPANNVVDPLLADLAKQVQKRDPDLVGFKLVSAEGKSIPVGETATFPLVDKLELTVKVEKPKDANGRVGLTTNPPGLGVVTYTCTCDKFFPAVTTHKTKAGETLIVAVMGKPCLAKK